jgi:diaminopimelate epimerase
MRVLMGKPTYNSAEIPVAGAERLVIDEPMRFLNREYRVTCLSIGNPHCVIPMDEISKEAAIGLGSRVESAPYFPNRINMQLLKVLSAATSPLKSTNARGLHAGLRQHSCAAASAAFRLGLVEPRHRGAYARRHAPDRDQPDESVYMTGPSTMWERLRVGRIPARAQGALISPTLVRPSQTTLCIFRMFDP